MNRFKLFAVGSLALFSSVASGQETLLIPGDRAASADLSKVVAAAAAAQLPVDPILSKVHLGVVRKARPAAIVAAAKQVAARLQDAREALAPNPTELDVVAGEGALSYRATKDALREIRAVSGGRSVAVPLGVLAQLLSSGVNLERATTVVTNLIRNSATEVQIVALGNNVNEDVRAGANADASLQTRVQHLAVVLGTPGGSSALLSTGDAAQAPGLSTSGKTNRSGPVPPRRP